MRLASLVNNVVPSDDDRMSWAGALRHVAWQSDITARNSADLAEKIGNCHEIMYFPNTEKRLFVNLDDADSTADLLNNELGRKNGTERWYLSPKQKMLRALVEARLNGLYKVRRNSSGQYEVFRERMDDKTYRAIFNEVINKYKDI